ncbi:MAG TPA: EAL domain-containing protein [Candidatus Limnocylindria bacterium]|nr:EAL domain-containing protein [Candidatus Limnocylindria bacterium]
MKRFELERAITENELLLHYQPMVEVPSRKLIGVEALVRWRHPERGLVSPLEFIPEAEATGLIRKLTFWVLREALLQASVWRRDGNPLTVAVNLSVDNLHDAHFRRFMELTLKVAGGPEHLIMEASSRALARDPEPPLATLELMRVRGIRVTLDDATDEDAHILESFPADIVKVSRGLITRMGRDHRAFDYVQAVVRAARERGLHTTAVGVEDEATWDRVRELGFSSAQGYLIAAPIPEAQLAEWRAARV